MRFTTVNRGTWRRIGRDMVDLEGGVPDAVSGLDQLFRGGTDGMAVGVGGDEDVRGEGGPAGRDLPQMQIVHFDHVIEGGSAGTDLVRLDSVGRGLHEDAPGFADEVPAALAISAATTSVATASARFQPVNQTTTPETAVPMKAYRSLRMCW